MKSVILALLLAASPVVALCTHQEDFEDGAVGDDWYTGGGSGSANAPGMDGTGFKWTFNGGAGSSGTFSLNTPFAVANMSFFFKTGNIVNENCVFFIEGDTGVIFHGQIAQTSLGAQASGSQTGMNGIVLDANEHELRFVFDWTAKTWTVSRDGSLLGSRFFVDMNNAQVTSFRVFRNLGNPCGPSLDQICLDEGAGVVVGVTTEPGEFDSGLVRAVDSLGFRTQESQFFFSLVLVGIATVVSGVLLKVMGPGRLKVVLVSLIAGLTGIFCVLIGFFDLWMYFLAIVLAGAVVWGAPAEARNTWMEIKAAIQRRDFGPQEQVFKPATVPESGEQD